jgi:thiamine kinase-like enzyme
VVHKTAQLTLQFVGDQAEDLANSIAHWSHRQDVFDGFYQYDARVYADSGDVIVSDFDQQGVNTVYAYNVRVRIVWADEIDTGQTKPMPNIVFQPGPITVQ